MAATEVIRVDEELVRAAKDTGELLGRSAAGQISHWARLGRAIENADVPSSAIKAVLTRQAEFDSLSEDEQRAVTALWSIQMQERIANLDLVSEFQATGAAYAYLDDDGNLIEVPRTARSASAPKGRSLGRKDPSPPSPGPRKPKTKTFKNPVTTKASGSAGQAKFGKVNERGAADLPKSTAASRAARASGR